MLDRQVLRTKERPTGHKSFLPQEVVRREVCTRGLEKMHNYRQQFPWREMYLTTFAAFSSICPEKIDILFVVLHSDDILGARMLWKPKEARIL
jgi:hypothetical protein